MLLQKAREHIILIHLYYLYQKELKWLYMKLQENL